MKTSITLRDYLLATFKDGLPYPDAVQLCMGLYSCANLLPPTVPAETLDKEGISRAFADFARCGKVNVKNTPDGEAVSVTEEQHWREVIERLFKTSDAVLDMQRVRRLLASAP